MLVGCAKQKQPTTHPAAASLSESSSAPTSVATPVAPKLTAHDLTGSWTLTLPLHHQRPAMIVAIDDHHLALEGCGMLSGTYLLQPPHLLILTTDERFRPLAWQIMGRDRLLLTRSIPASAVGPDYTGSTLTRNPTTR